MASAPGKVILIGEHFVVYGTSAILCAIDKRITVHAETIPKNTLIVKSNIGNLTAKIDAKTEEIDSTFRPIFHLVKQLCEKHDYDAGISIRVESEIPSGMGLGSSSACCVASAAAISSLFGESSKKDTLRLAIDAEKTIYPDSSGADCTVCMYGGIMTYSKDGKFTRINPAPNFKLVIANSNMKHDTKTLVSNVAQFKQSNTEKFLEMCDIENNLVRDVLSLVKKNDLIGLGKCMTKNQALLKIIGVSNDKLDKMINVANETSFGSKITGAGGGGCTISINDESSLQDTINNLEKNGIECFSTKIDFKGLDTF